MLRMLNSTWVPGWARSLTWVLNWTRSLAWILALGSPSPIFFACGAQNNVFHHSLGSLNPPKFSPPAPNFLSQSTPEISWNRGGVTHLGPPHSLGIVLIATPCNEWKGTFQNDLTFFVGGVRRYPCRFELFSETTFFIFGINEKYFRIFEKFRFTFESRWVEW